MYSTFGKHLLCVAGFLTAASVISAEQGPASVVPGKYHCVFFINNSLTTTPGFTIQNGGVYLHDNGGKGHYTYKAGEALIEFNDGPLEKQAGRVGVNEKTGTINLYNERRSRTVMDCDTPRK